MKNTVMKALFSFLFLLFFWLSANAQNYDCLQYGPKNYFINSYSYVRGIRIDSTRTFGGDSVYYPYRTTRIADTMGASVMSHIL